MADAERDIVLSATRFWDATRWDLLAAVVMPDHVHALACPLANGAGRWSLGTILHSVKSYSAHRIAERRAGTPSLIWQDERYDRWMRDEDEIAEKWGYIVGNPVRAGLVGRAEEYRWLYQKAGGTPAPPPTTGPR